MRLWVRSGVQINLSFGFSRAVGSASDTSNDKVLSQPIKPYRQAIWFQGKKAKTTLPEAPTCIAEFLYVGVRYPRLDWRILTPFPFKIRGKACVCGTHLSFRIDKPMSNCCSHEKSYRAVAPPAPQRTARTQLNVKLWSIHSPR